MKKHEYRAPDVEIVQIDGADVISTSADGPIVDFDQNDLASE